MNPNKKVLFTFLSFVLAMVVIACSCDTIIPTFLTPEPSNPMPGLAGTWQDQETSDTFVIAWQNGQYVVTSVTWGEDSYSITSQSWTGSSLTWSYYDTYISLTVTHSTTSLSGDSLYANWSYSDGTSGTETLQRMSPVLSPVTPESVIPEPVTPETQPNILTNPDSLTVTSAQAGIVTNATGVSILIPAGAVPANPDGSIGSMIFSISRDDSTVPSLPGGYVAVGPVVNLGPEGFVFEQPVTISIPLSTGVNPASVMGAAYYDPGKSVWVLVPGSVDQTNNTVQVSSTHLSIWTAWGLIPQMPVDDPRYGSFRVTRPPANISYGGPDYKYSGATTGHGICIRSATYTDPNVTGWWDAPDNFTFMVNNYWGGITADDRQPFELYRVPTGSYQITEFITQSEINPGNPMYIPHFYQLWRDLGTIPVAGNQIVEFPFPGFPANWNSEDTAWTVGRPACWGTVTTSVQTGGEGGVQVTLNWNSNADIDLHVVEPDGTEIYFSNTVSSSGGTLDRDNRCSDFVLGRPENIFWETPPNGTYQVNVVYYFYCSDAGPVNFTVRVCKKGICTDPIGGTVNAVDDTVSVTSFEYP